MISVIIPTLNEEKALPATLASLIGQTWLKEICIVDGGSDDATLSVIGNFSSQLPQLKIISAPRGRGSQMNAVYFYMPTLYYRNKVFKKYTKQAVTPTY